MTLQILAIIAAVFHLLGIASAVQAIMETRTPQGAVAWVLGLITFPYVVVPAYWVFGRSRFRGFVALRRADLVKTVPAARRYLDELKTGELIAFPERQHELSIERLAKLPFTVGNDVELLVDGKANFDNRSFRLNFEITLVVADQRFNGEVARMLEADFARSRRVNAADIRAKGPLFRFAVRSAQLTAPIQ